MGISERKEREKKQRVDSILHAATDVLLEKGMEAATVNDVAQKAELGKGTLYLYFKSKDEILCALCNEALISLHQAFLKAAARKKTGRDKVEALGMAYFDFYKKHPLKFQLINFLNHGSVVQHVGEGNEQLAHCLSSAQQTIGFMVECIVQGIQDKSISKNIEPLQTAMILWSCSTGFIQTLSVHGDSLKDDFGISLKKYTDYFFSLMNSMLKEYKP